MSDGLWGLLDGMNAAGLVLSLTFGGRQVVGEGFGVPLILRYVLEFCRTTEEATEVLARIPCHMTYNTFHVSGILDQWPESQKALRIEPISCRILRSLIR